MELTEKEKSRQKKLLLEKPYVYGKVMKFPEKIKNNESIAIIQLQYNYACNMKCEHCSINSIQQQGLKNNRRKLTPDDVADLARQADELGLARFEINGGEPLVNKDLPELVKAIDPSKFYMNLVTNAWLLNYNKAKELKELGIDRIQIGLDSLNAEEHDDFRRKKGSHKKSLEAVDHCLNVGLDVFVTTVVTKQRLRSNEFIKFVEYFNNKDVGVFVTFAKPVGAWEYNFDALVDKDDLKYMEELEKKYNVWSHITPFYGKEGGCLAFRGLIAITQYGDVMPCQYIFSSFGNIFDEPLKDILERGMKLKVFKTDTCPIAEDMNFIQKYVVNKIYGRELPVPYNEVFNDEDFE